jgi:hypothetical protein
LALGRLLPGWAAGAAGEPEPGVDPVLVLGEGVIRLLCGLVGKPGCVVVLEDLHWADADTFALLEYLAGRLPDFPLLVAGSARDDEPGSEAVGRLAAMDTVRSLALSRLDPAEIAALAGARSDGRLPAGELTAVVARAGGLPRNSLMRRPVLRLAGQRRRLPYPARWPHSCAAGWLCSPGHSSAA